MSFPAFKKEYYSGILFQKSNINVSSLLRISFKINNNYKDTYKYLENTLSIIEKTLSTLTNSWFKEKDLEEALNIKFKSKEFSKRICQLIISSYSGFVYGISLKIEDNAFIQSRLISGEYTYRIYGNKYLRHFMSIKRKFLHLFEKNERSQAERYLTNKEINTIDYIKLGYFLEILNLGTFEIAGGENPLIFIRINDPYKIKKDSESTNYLNSILSKVTEKHELSYLIFDHFFLNSFSNEERWNFIESFFLGEDTDSLLENYNSDKIENLNSNNKNIVNYIIENNDNTQNVIDKNTIDKNNTLHIFTPKPNAFYFNDSYLTIETEHGNETMKLREWIQKYPVLLDKTRRKYDFKIHTITYKNLMIKLERDSFEYFKESLGLNLKIYYKNNRISASVLYKDTPIEFYKWWCSDENKIKLSFKEKLTLFNNVNEIDSKLLLSKHKKLLNNK